MKYSLLLVLIACLVLNAVATCKWTSPSGDEYNFKAGNNDEVTVTIDRLTYSFSFCGGKPSQKECASQPNSPAACIYDDERFHIVSGRWDDTPEWSPVISENPQGGLILDLTNGDPFRSGQPSELIINLTCGNSKTATLIDSIPIIRMNIEHPFGCSGGGSGLSGGAIFLIIFFSLLAAYFIIGFIVCKFVLKKEGINAIPQGAFWCALPGLYIGGIKFVIGKITGKGKSSDGFESSSDTYGSTEEV